MASNGIEWHRMASVLWTHGRSHGIMARMSWITDIIGRRAAMLRMAQTTPDTDDAGPTPPRRRPSGGDPLALSTIFRAVQILQTSIVNLPIIQTKDGIPTGSSSLVLRPDPLATRSRFLSETVADLALNGNAFWQRIDVDGRTLALRLLPAHYVGVRATSNDPASPAPVYDYQGRTYTPDEILHLRFLEVSGRLRGLGPIQAAREEVESASLMADLKRDWFTDGSKSGLALLTDQPLEPDQAKQIADRYAAGDPTRPKVLGWGTKPERLALSPEDLHYLDMMQFDTTQIARLMGIPASLMLAPVEGSNLTYQNVEQSWLEFADYTLAAYATEIADAMTTLLPRGHAIRFDTDPARRSNTKDRYEAYRIGLEANFLTVDEIRQWEKLAPLTEQKEDQHDLQ